MAFGVMFIFPSPRKDQPGEPMSIGLLGEAYRRWGIFFLLGKRLIFILHCLEDSRPVILNRGPHGPPGGNLQVLGGGGIQSISGIGEEWTPSGGNQQIAINRPGCSSGWRIVAASPVFVDVTLWPEGSSALPQDTVPRPKWTLGLWRTTFLAPRHSYFWQKWKCITGATNFKISFKIWLLMHMAAYTGKVPWPSSATARGLGGGNNKLAIEKGGNLPEKVENHCSRPSIGSF